MIPPYPAIFTNFANANDSLEIMNSRGRKPRSLTVYPLYNELVIKGYDSAQVARNLKIAPKRMKSVFQRPELLMLWQIERIGYLINKPLGYVLNLCTFSKPNNPNWISDDYDLNQHIQIIKNRSKN